MENKDILGNLGYLGKLCILPFDHRSFFEELLQFKEPLSDDQKKQLSEYKKIIYAGYEKSLTLGIPQNETGMLVDDVYGLDILLDSKTKGYVTIQTTEKSGIDHFAFEHDSEWQNWIEKVKPAFTKALVRYNVDDHKEQNMVSLQGLKQLSDYSHAKGYKFLIEPLVPASADQLNSVGNDKHRYDRELRPTLTARMIAEMQNAGIEPDVWKIEGMFGEADYGQVVQAAQANGRTHVGIVSLGRNETDEVVETWLRVGAKVPGVIGFAVGRTVFLNALMKFRSNEYTKDQAIEEIAKNFLHFYKVFAEPQ